MSAQLVRRELDDSFSGTTSRLAAGTGGCNRFGALSKPLDLPQQALDLVVLGHSPTVAPGGGTVTSVGKLGQSPHSRRCPRQDSNLRAWLRRPLLYPLSYGGSGPPSG